MNFAEMWQSWLKASTGPNDATFAELRQKPDATVTTAVIWMAIYGVVAAIAGLISSMIFAGTIQGALPAVLEQMNLPPAEAAQVEQALRFLPGNVAAGAGFSSLANIVMVAGLVPDRRRHLSPDRPAAGRDGRIRPPGLPQRRVQRAAGDRHHTVVDGASGELPHADHYYLQPRAGLLCRQGGAWTQQRARHHGDPHPRVGDHRAGRLLHLRHRRYGVGDSKLLTG